MGDSTNALLLVGVGILIGIGFASLMLLIQKQSSYVVMQPSYVEYPQSVRR